MILGSWGPLNSRATCTGRCEPNIESVDELSTAPRGPTEGQTCTLCGWSWGLSSQESRCRGQGGGHLGALAGHVRGRWGHARLVPAASWPRSWLHSPRNCAGPKATAWLGTRRGRCYGRPHLWNKTTKGESHSSKELSKEMKSTTIQSNQLHSVRTWSQYSEIFHNHLSAVFSQQHNSCLSDHEASRCRRRRHFWDLPLISFGSEFSLLIIPSSLAISSCKDHFWSLLWKPKYVN